MKHPPRSREIQNHLSKNGKGDLRKKMIGAMKSTVLKSLLANNHNNSHKKKVVIAPVAEDVANVAPAAGAETATKRAAKTPSILPSAISRKTTAARSNSENPAKTQDSWKSPRKASVSSARDNSILSRHLPTSS